MVLTPERLKLCRWAGIRSCIPGHNASSCHPRIMRTEAYDLDSIHNMIPARGYTLRPVDLLALLPGWAPKWDHPLGATWDGDLRRRRQIWMDWVHLDPEWYAMEFRSQRSSS